MQSGLKEIHSTRPSGSLGRASIGSGTRADSRARSDRPLNRTHSESSLARSRSSSRSKGGLGVDANGSRSTSRGVTSITVNLASSKGPGVTAVGRGIGHSARTGIVRGSSSTGAPFSGLADSHNWNPVASRNEPLVSLSAESSLHAGGGTTNVAREVLTLVQRELGQVRTELLERDRSESDSCSALYSEIGALRRAADRAGAAHASERDALRTHIESLMGALRTIEAQSIAEKQAFTARLSDQARASESRETSYRSQLADQSARLEQYARVVATLGGTAKGADDPSAAPTIASLQASLHEALSVRSGELERAQAELLCLRTSLAAATEASQSHANARATAMEQEVSELRRALKAGESREADLRASVSSLTRTVEECGAAARSQVEAQEERRRAGEHEAATERQALQVALANALQEIESSRKAHDASIADAQRVRTELAIALGSKDSALSGLEASVKDVAAGAAAERVAYEQRLFDAREDAAAARDESDTARRALLDTLAKSSAAESGLRREVAAAHDAAAEAARLRENREAVAAAEIAGLASRLALVEEASASSQAEMAGIVSDLRSALEAAEAAASRQAEGASATLAAAVKAWRGQVDALSSRLCSLQEAVGSGEINLARERDAAHARECALQANVTAARRQGEEAERMWAERVAALEGQVRALQAEVASASARLVAATAVRARIGVGVEVLHSPPTLSESSHANVGAILTLPGSPVSHTDAFLAGVMGTARRTSMGVGGGQDRDAEGKTGMVTSQQAQSLAPLLAAGTPVLDPRLLDLASTFGACALATVWVQERDAAATAYAALSKAAAVAADRAAARSGPSETVRAALARELMDVRAAYQEASAGRSEARAAIDTIKREAAAYNESKDETLAQAAKAVNGSTKAVQAALVAAQEAAAACTGERHALEADSRASVDKWAAELHGMRTRMDEMRAAVDAQGKASDKYAKEIASAHAKEAQAGGDVLAAEKQGLVEMVQLANSREAIASGARDSVADEAARAAALAAVEIARLSVLATAAHESYQLLQAQTGEREAASRSKERLLTSELGRLSAAALLASEQAEGAVQAVAARYEEWSRDREDGLRRECEDARQGMDVLRQHSEVKGAALGIALDALAGAVGGLRRAEHEHEKASAANEDISSRLNTQLRESCHALLSRLHSTRDRLEGEVDTLREKAVGLDKAAPGRLAPLLAKAQALLTRTHGSGNFQPHEAALLTTLVERLRPTASLGGHSIASMAAAEVTELRAEVDKLSRALAAGKAEADVEAEARLAETARVQAALDRARQAYRDATASSHPSVSYSTSTGNRAASDAISSLNSSRAVAVPPHVGRGMGLTSPELARGSGRNVSFAAHASTHEQRGMEGHGHREDGDIASPIELGHTKHPAATSAMVSILTRSPEEVGALALSYTADVPPPQPGPVLGGPAVVSINLLGTTMMESDDGDITVRDLLPAVGSPVNHGQWVTGKHGMGWGAVSGLTDDSQRSPRYSPAHDGGQLGSSYASSLGQRSQAGPLVDGAHGRPVTLPRLGSTMASGSSLLGLSMTVTDTSGYTRTDSPS